MRKYAWFCIAAAVAVCAAMFGVAAAESSFGVTVYPGAKPDPASAAAVTEAYGVEVACYRTAEGLTKVSAFYKRQPGLRTGTIEKELAYFSKGRINITVQNPWVDIRTGALNRTTLICIGR